MARELSERELALDNCEQIKEALSDENKWFAGERLGRTPTDEEAILHYILYGGSKKYRTRKMTQNK